MKWRSTPGHTTPEDIERGRRMKQQRYWTKRLPEIFSKKEVVRWVELPKKLRDQVDPFPDFVFPL